MRSDDILEGIRSNWPDVLTHRAATAILAHRLLKRLSARRDPILKQHDLSQAEFDLLLALRCTPAPHEMQPTALYGRLLVSSGGLTKLLRRLEERSLIARPVGTGDRRRRPVALSQEGIALLEKLARELRIGSEDRLGDDEFAEVERHLTYLLRRIEQGPTDLSRMSSSLRHP